MPTPINTRAPVIHSPVANSQVTIDDYDCTVIVHYGHPAEQNVGLSSGGAFSTFLATLPAVGDHIMLTPGGVIENVPREVVVVEVRPVAWLDTEVGLPASVSRQVQGYVIQAVLP